MFAWRCFRRCLVSFYVREEKFDTVCLVWMLIPSHLKCGSGVDRLEVIVHCSLFVVKHDERNDPGPNDHHKRIVGQDHEGSNDASEETRAVCLPLSCEQGWQGHHSGTGIAGTSVLVCSLKANPVDGPFTAKLGGLPR